MGNTKKGVIMDINSKDESENSGIESDVISGSNSSTDKDMGNKSGDSSKATFNSVRGQDSSENSSSSNTNEVLTPSSPFRKNTDLKNTFTRDNSSYKLRSPKKYKSITLDKDKCYLSSRLHLPSTPILSPITKNGDDMIL